jgi:Holliday junction resolvase RusA-like endonuclease
MTRTPIVFEVLGKPEPQGSARAFMPNGAKYPVVTSDNPNLKSWRRDVAKAAALAHVGPPIEGPVRVVVDFHLPRPKALRVDRAHVTRPDCDKLLRGVGDALTGVVIRDDGQVTQIKGTKQYARAGESPRAVIAVTPLEEEGRLL